MCHKTTFKKRAARSVSHLEPAPIIIPTSTQEYDFWKMCGSPEQKVAETPAKRIHRAKKKGGANCAIEKGGLRVDFFWDHPY